MAEDDQQSREDGPADGQILHAMQNEGIPDSLLKKTLVQFKTYSESHRNVLRPSLAATYVGTQKLLQCVHILPLTAHNCTYAPQKNAIAVSLHFNFFYINFFFKKF